MRIAIFDYKVIPTNPIGSCHHKLLAGLSAEHDFVVFSPMFENPDPARIRHVRVPVPMRPLAALFVAYHLMSPIVYLLYRLRGGKKPDLFQTVESNSLIGCDLIYSHFCHRRFLKTHWPAVRTGGLRGALRKLDHWLHALLEPLVYRRAKRVVVPSRGLERELSAEYPMAAGKIEVLANPVDLDRMKRPDDFDRANKRAELGFSENDVVLLFVALGHFERKGLPLILEAMARPALSGVKLNVVGGEPDLIANWDERAKAMNLGGRVVFSGMQRDVRPHFWAADAFALPSIYEVFPLVSLEAAAAGVPMICTALNGVEEFLRDGHNGLLVDERSAAGVGRAIERLCALSADQRREIARQAQQDVQRYSVLQFRARWRDVYVAAQGPALGSVR